MMNKDEKFLRTFFPRLSSVTSTMAGGINEIV